MTFVAATTPFVGMVVGVVVVVVVVFVFVVVARVMAVVVGGGPGAEGGVKILVTLTD